jgi:hypothetical protein
MCFRSGDSNGQTDPARQGGMVRFRNGSRVGITQDDECCPNGHMCIDEGEGYKICYLCYYDTMTGMAGTGSGGGA